jgi:hypothetical protein
VLAAVNLNNQTSVMANEVKNVSSERHLSSETQTFEAMRSQCIPKLPLRTGHAPAKRLRLTFFAIRDCGMGHWD